MNRLHTLLVAVALFVVADTAVAQTRNVLMRSREADSIEQANMGNRKFHSAFRSYQAGADTAELMYGLQMSSGTNNHFMLEPLVNLAYGVQDYGEGKLSDAMLGLHAEYTCGSKFTVSASMAGGYEQPLMSTSILADSMGRYPQMDGFSRKDNSYLARYFEIYANYRPAKFIGLSLGKGKKHIGDGYRSMLLSASNSGMYYFDMDVTLGNFKYVFSMNTAQNWDNECDSYRQMYMIYHAFSYNPAKWLNIGGYEAVMQIRRDTLGNTKMMDLHYINPMLFFRPLEFSLGSPDDAIMGLFGKITYLKHHQAYAQFMLDDFNFVEIKEHQGTWNNKYSYQMGLKGFFGNLSYILEFDYIRPFIYSHDKSVNTYSMYHQPLANPFGANLKELLADIRYRCGNWDLELLIDHVNLGRDEDEMSMGNNIFKSYDLHKYQFGNKVGQGISEKNTHVAIMAEYRMPMLRNLRLYARAGRQQMFGNNNKYFVLGIKTSRLFFDRSY
ncbi:MAG: hypothetical protein MJZ66_04790 [Bacteroidales bacterium]|nr:hypothetical protein [Bacteroidales bacterium]